MITPQKYRDNLGAEAGKLMESYGNYMYDRIKFNHPESMVHGHKHCERVLYFAMRLGDGIMGENDKDALTALAHAAIFHDSRRENDYGDVGHGARGADYYKEFCKMNPDIRYYPEAALMMRFHDLNDNLGLAAIDKEFPLEKERMNKLYAIFKDADALDRWRLGNRGLDTRFLRTDEAKRIVDEAHRLVRDTEDPEWLKSMEKKVNEILDRNKKST